MVGDEGECGVRVAVDLPARADAVLELADVGDELAARVDDARGPQVRVDDADEGGVVGAGRGRGARVKVRLGREVERDVLLGDEPGADARAQVLVQEARDLCGAYVPPALEEALRQDGDGVGVGVDQLGQDLGEADLILERGEGVLAVGRVLEPREQGGERVLVVVVDLGDMAVGYDDVRQVAQGLYAVGETNWEQRQREAGRREEGFCREGWAAVSAVVVRLSVLPN